MIIINSLEALIYQAFSEGDGAETKNAQTVQVPPRAPKNLDAL